MLLLIISFWVIWLLIGQYASFLKNILGFDLKMSYLSGGRVFNVVFKRIQFSFSFRVSCLGVEMTLLIWFIGCLLLWHIVSKCRIYVRYEFYFIMTQSTYKNNVEQSSVEDLCVFGNNATKIGRIKWNCLWGLKTTR